MGCRYGMPLYRVLAIMCLTALLGACAATSGNDTETALVRLGGIDHRLPAADHADLFLDYALIADQTYTDDLYKQRPPTSPIGNGTYCAERTVDGEPCRDLLGLTPYARARLGRWKLAYAYLAGDKGFPCPTDQRFGCDIPVGGLGVQIWLKKGRVCSEAVIAFRGTDGGSADDWLSNLRWVLRLLPLYDQYTQVQDYTPGLIDLLKSEPCYVQGRTRIVAVGHSLGGGLAQQSGYRDGRIVHVYAFDPSVVTGFYDLPPRVRDANKAGLSIERLYEQGEVLAYPRAVLAQVNPPTACDPLIRTIRLHTVVGSPIARHKLNSIATALLRWSKERRETGQPAKRPLPATDGCRSKDRDRSIVAGNGGLG